MTKRKKNKMTDDLAQLAMAAPMVIAHRMMRMAQAGASPSADDRREMSRMSAEKFDAFIESLSSTAMGMTLAYMNFGLDLMRLAWSPWHQTGGLIKAAAARYGDATTTSMEGSLAPIRRRAVANAKRLGRKRRG